MLKSHVFLVAGSLDSVQTSMFSKDTWSPERVSPQLCLVGKICQESANDGIEGLWKRCAQCYRLWEEGLPAIHLGCSATARPHSFELVPCGEGTELVFGMGPSSSDINFLPPVLRELLASLYLIISSALSLCLFRHHNLTALLLIATAGIPHLSSGQWGPGSPPQPLELQCLGEC